MTSPQIYIKVTGTWTGGHEENLRFRSINMNHGPGDSDWYGVGMKDSLKFRELVKKQHNMDIYKKEGIWFPTLDWFMTNKIEVFYGVQEMHDVCIVGVGCLHWVRARNHSINSSWNFGSKDLLQIKSSYERFEINKEIQFNSLVKMNTLVLDYLNSEMKSVPDDLFEFCDEKIRLAIANSFQEVDNINRYFDKKHINICKEPYVTHEII
jgi:histone demethylase